MRKESMETTTLEGNPVSVNRNRSTSSSVLDFSLVDFDEYYCALFVSKLADRKSVV